MLGSTIRAPEFTIRAPCIKLVKKNFNCKIMKDVLIDIGQIDYRKFKDHAHKILGSLIVLALERT